MRQFSAALLSRALGTVKDLFTPPCGRHSRAGGRRRRSTRVRRYAPVPDSPVQVNAIPERPKLPIPAPCLAPSREQLPADDIALVRPYYASHERELAHIQAKATARLHGWANKTAPTGDLLATVPAPRTPDKPREWDELERLTRVWITQQEQRQAQAVPA